MKECFTLRLRYLLLKHSNKEILKFSYLLVRNRISCSSVALYPFVKQLFRFRDELTESRKIPNTPSLSKVNEIYKIYRRKKMDNRILQYSMDDINSSPKCWKYRFVRSSHINALSFLCGCSALSTTTNTKFLKTRVVFDM